jgi:hypothetical protein
MQRVPGERQEAITAPVARCASHPHEHGGPEESGAPGAEPGVGAVRAAATMRADPAGLARTAIGRQAGWCTPRPAWTAKFSPDWSIIRWTSRPMNTLSATAPTGPSGTS